MKTKKNLVLFLVVFAMVAMLVSCNSVVIAQESYIDTQIIRTEDKGEVCIKLDKISQCGTAVDCKTNKPLDRFSVKEIFGVKYIEVPGSPCDSFTADNGRGNTRYYCSGGWCFPY